MGLFRCVRLSCTTQEQIKNAAVKATHKVQETTEAMGDKAKEMVGISNPTADSVKETQHKSEVGQM